MKLKKKFLAKRLPDVKFSANWKTSLLKMSPRKENLPPSRISSGKWCHTKKFLQNFFYIYFIFYPDPHLIGCWKIGILLLFFFVIRCGLYLSFYLICDNFKRWRQSDLDWSDFISTEKSTNDQKFFSCVKKDLFCNNTTWNIYKKRNEFTLFQISLVKGYFQNF